MARKPWIMFRVAGTIARPAVAYGERVRWRKKSAGVRDGEDLVGKTWAYFACQ